MADKKDDAAKRRAEVVDPAVNSPSEVAAADKVMYYSAGWPSSPREHQPAVPEAATEAAKVEVREPVKNEDIKPAPEGAEGGLVVTAGEVNKEISEREDT